MPLLSTNVRSARLYLGRQLLGYLDCSVGVTLTTISQFILHHRGLTHDQIALLTKCTIIQIAFLESRAHLVAIIIRPELLDMKHVHW